MNSKEEGIRSSIEATHLVQSIIVYQKCDQVDAIPQFFHVINDPVHCCLEEGGKEKGSIRLCGGNSGHM